MSFFGKSFAHEKDENYEAYIDSLASAGMPQERVTMFKYFKPVQRLVKNGDTYTLYANAPSENKEISFELGQEFDEVLTPKYVAKTTYKLDGNVLRQVQKFPGDIVLNITREYFDDKLIVTMTNNKWGGKAVRYYKLKN